MSKWHKVLFTVAIGTEALFSTIASYSQDKRNLLAPVVTSAPRPQSGGVRTVYVPKIERRTERIPITSFTVATMEGATVVLEQLPGKKRGKLYKDRKIADATNTAVFQGLPGGTYQLEVSKDGFATVRAKDVGIVAQTAQAINLSPGEIIYNIQIATGVTGGGDVRFAPADFLAKDPDGSIRSKQRGPYCVAKIQPNGIAEISDLKKGYYDIDIRPDSQEYANTFSGIELVKGPGDPENPDSAILKSYDLKVEKNQSTETFTTTWIPSDWELPAAFRLEDRKMKVKNATGIAIPANPRYKYYVNFEMIAHVRLMDDGTVGFVFRQQDPNNYYLLQISGERGETPNNAVLYVVKDGQRQPLPPALTSGFAKTLASDDGFEISIAGDDTAFTAWITDVNTGKQSTLARFPDTFKTFKKGAVGIAGSPKSNFEVKTFQVCTPTCPK